MPYWFNVQTNNVETENERSPITDLLGPYPTYEEAERALDSAHARSKQQDQEEDTEA